MTEHDEPELGYAGTSGHARVDTSRDAITADDLQGITAEAQRLTMILADQAGARGITIAELREARGALHHGKMSSALTNLHKAGRLVALRERRNKCGVYVLPEHQNGRDARAYKPNQKPISVEVIHGILVRHRYIDSRPGASSRCLECDWNAGRVPHVSWHDHLAAAIVDALS